MSCDGGGDHAWELVVGPVAIENKTDVVFCYQCAKCADRNWRKNSEFEEEGM